MIILKCLISGRTADVLPRFFIAKTQSLAFFCVQVYALFDIIHYGKVECYYKRTLCAIYNVEIDPKSTLHNIPKCQVRGMRIWA